MKSNIIYFYHRRSGRRREACHVKCEPNYVSYLILGYIFYVYKVQVHEWHSENYIFLCTFQLYASSALQNFRNKSSCSQNEDLLQHDLSDTSSDKVNN